MFPGLISLAIIVYACLPAAALETSASTRPTPSSSGSSSPSTRGCRSRCSPPGASAGWRARGRAPWLVAPLVYVVGYGPLLTAMTAASYVKELQGAEMRWDKTEKTGRVGELV